MSGAARGAPVSALSALTPAAAATALVLAAALAPASTARAQTYVKTHGMMLDSVATVVAGELVGGTAMPAGRPIVVLTPVRGDTMGLLTQRLVERLHRDGRYVRIRERSPFAAPGGFAGADSAGFHNPGPLELHARVDGASVSYVRRLRSFPFGTRGYERLTSMRGSATLLDPATGQVLWARSANASASDVVSRRDLAYVASGSGGINPGLPQGSGFRVLEPLIVLGVVAGLVVLFYSNRN